MGNEQARLPASQLLDNVTTLTKNRKFIGAYRGQINKVFNTELAVATERQHLLTLITNATLDSKNKLDQCRPDLLAKVLPDAARTGLSLDPNLGHLYVYPYSGVPAVKVGYKGIMHLAYLSSTLKQLNVQLVRANDHYEETHTSAGPDFVFKPARGKQGDIVGCFVHAIFTIDGKESSYLEYVYADEVQKYYGSSPAWTGFKGQMVRKFTIRRASVYWPKDKILNEMVAVMDEFDDKVDFGEVSKPEPADEGYVCISEEQRMELYAMVFDFNYARFNEDDEKAKKTTENWMERLAEKFTVPTIASLPQDMYDEAKQATVERIKKVEEASQ